MIARTSKYMLHALVQWDNNSGRILVSTIHQNERRNVEVPSFASLDRLAHYSDPAFPHSTDPIEDSKELINGEAEDVEVLSNDEGGPLEGAELSDREGVHMEV